MYLYQQKGEHKLIKDLDIVKLLKNNLYLDVMSKVLFSTQAHLLMKTQKSSVINSDLSDENSDAELINRESIYIQDKEDVNAKDIFKARLVRCFE